ncbi:MULTISPECIES: acyl-CoA dehydrogenase family protein [unclassified Cupriavidus]|uniref:acyl-CoA dehydrogenase family protein n=1 Tax=unclassified Cupriavidus TaxID=2640874 RepID=UPI001C0086BB|nr:MULTISPECIES: acyl-CoA dehydrogenase family protein [unclassified Cupriavidus]MCA3188905.1 acyl-CoA dehydrogenase family protein [Cupriavidus sp.]MCA3198625.1 acyl-CoA dehydrogenase family protein [Cupriavidus sp.]MCA3201371.1 acyl-CoA dehydrogenase family protein [Cupriavidus sp.]MCA3209764.1 acyl-CoA dehydrogenase family protein [Cupriavidus sp.]MCA3232038.1 acyl-CoA dehydrogenase family protein [Cupriavidus sp.]
MDLRFTREEEAFREEVGAFVRASLPADIRDKVLGHRRVEKDDYVRWHRILHAQGWGAPTWPTEWGGTGWNALQRLIFEIETFRAGAPRMLPFGLTMIGPVLMKYASAEHKARFLPRIPTVEDFWCQGYSEPGAGSDLASLRTRAVRKGDKYIVNGQKTWTTMAHFADWIFCLVRTDAEAKPQEGISMLLIDMKSPGVTVRPIKTLDGGHDVNETWFEDVEVPVENLLGEKNRGWTYAKYLLGHERTGIAGIGHCYRELRQLRHYAAETTDGRGRPLIEDVRMRDKIARVEMDLLALEMLLLRVATQAAGTPGPEASMVKIRGSELQQDIAMLQMEVAGPNGWPYSPDWMEPGAPQPVTGPDWAAPAASTYYDMRKTTIYGGSTEVQKSIIAKMIIGF